MADNQLQGLLIPIEPMTWASPWLVALLLVIVLWVLWRWWLFRLIPQVVAKRHITSLQQGFVENQYSTKLVAMQLTRYLREGLSLTRLDTYKLIDAETQKRWQDFLSRLNLACYADNEENDISQLSHEAIQWLEYSIEVKP
ncbi:MAG: hypothetical protein KAH22_07340 [Thiotrichaceae bacterium]|nr:hypothetical protein [Thiotrichaceae bacterium]